VRGDALAAAAADRDELGAAQFADASHLPRLPLRPAAAVLAAVALRPLRDIWPRG
jgi:hypothetical protein